MKLNPGSEAVKGEDLLLKSAAQSVEYDGYTQQEMTTCNQSVKLSLVMLPQLKEYSTLLQLGSHWQSDNDIN